MYFLINLGYSVTIKVIMCILNILDFFHFSSMTAGNFSVGGWDWCLSHFQKCVERSGPFTQSDFEHSERKIRFILLFYWFICKKCKKYMHMIALRKINQMVYKTNVINNRWCHIQRWVSYVFHLWWLTDWLITETIFEMLYITIGLLLSPIIQSHDLLSHGFYFGMYQEIHFKNVCSLIYVA